ncbi:YggS family pyridoxal phosphate-dependent enzyme [Phocaeicola coprocola]|uniref:YggS family pyridoxal phosphate-dependent enzyme n=1 Tax=Phocaeicola coprocola TaxID=310298 RepID=UPI0022E1C8A7|nr:YggS family pyridoxal phosphate-dependent enzyme [Phocaeicola coprocola]
MDIQANLKEVIAELPTNVRLVAVSKFHPAEAIEAAYSAGQRIFGESKEQELSGKHEQLPKDIEWHFIGHLQTNKVKYIAPYIAMIHAADSYKLLVEINKQAAKHERTIPCLLEIHIAQEESKYGFTFDSCREMLRTGEWKNLNNICIAGVMGMATNTEDETEIANEFHSLKVFFDELKQEFFSDRPEFKEISMGMSHDYPIAVKEGSTMIRVGSKIFGDRNY